jgi:hypothetical protein
MCNSDNELIKKFQDPFLRILIKISDYKVKSNKIYVVTNSFTNSISISSQLIKEKTSEIMNVCLLPVQNDNRMKIMIKNHAIDNIISFIKQEIEKDHRKGA